MSTTHLKVNNTQEETLAKFVASLTEWENLKCWLKYIIEEKTAVAYFKNLTKFLPLNTCTYLCLVGKLKSAADALFIVIKNLAKFH